MQQPLELCWGKFSGIHTLPLMLRSNLSEIDGIGVLSSLRKLHIADNSIDDLTPLAMHASLEVRSTECPKPVVEN
jgi:hypothetical protein